MEKLISSLDLPWPQDFKDAIIFFIGRLDVDLSIEYLSLDLQQLMSLMD